MSYRDCLQKPFVGALLCTNLDYSIRLFRNLGNDAAFIDGQCERLFAVNIFP